MKNLFISLILISTIVVVFLISPLESKFYSMAKSKQNYQIGHTIGCHDGQSGKSPDLTQYDRVGGFSKHSIEYNNGYVDGYNLCSKSQQIDPTVD